MSAQRHRPARVLPLELWDALIDGEPLYWLPAEQKPEAIASLVCALRAGSARRLRAHASLPEVAFERVVLAGGADLGTTLAALRARGLDAEVAPDPAWIAEPGGRALLHALAANEGAVIDVGQTALKLGDRDGRARRQRDLNEIPLELDARDPDQAPLYRARTVEFIASTLRARARPDALVMGLPCEIGDDLYVAGCSYPWPAGDATLIADILRSAGLERIPCLVLNDAELAALSVDLICAAHERTLVLTLGLGLGAAYLI